MAVGPEKSARKTASRTLKEPKVAPSSNSTALCPILLCPCNPDPWQGSIKGVQPDVRPEVSSRTPGFLKIPEGGPSNTWSCTVTFPSWDCMFVTSYPILSGLFRRLPSPVDHVLAPSYSHTNVHNGWLGSRFKPSDGFCEDLGARSVGKLGSGGRKPWGGHCQP